MFRNRDRLVKIFVWIVVIGMLITVFAAIAPALG